MLLLAEGKLMFSINDYKGIRIKKKNNDMLR